MQNEKHEIYPGYDPYAVGDQLFTVVKDGVLLVDAWNECRLIDAHTEDSSVTFIFQKRYPGNGSLDVGTIARFEFSGLDAANLAAIQAEPYAAALSLQRKSGEVFFAALPGTSHASPVAFKKATLLLEEPQWQEQSFRFGDADKSDIYMTQLTYQGHNLFDLRSDTTVVHTLYDPEKELCTIICSLGEAQDMSPEGTLIKLQFSNAKVAKLSIEGEDMDDLGRFDDIAVIAKGQYRIRYGASITLEITSMEPRLFVQKQEVS